MKTIKHGKVNRVITCNCACEFEFDMVDVQKEPIYSACSSYYPEPKKYVSCPDCGAKIYIKTPLDTQEFKVLW